MLKRMELWDFESHEHTVIEDLSPGLNFVCGESNSGKTSLVRALKLVAYNEFDPRSIRVGATKCQVLVETDRGTVKVTRGPKNNLWEVTKKGEKTQYLDKVGKDVVKQAAEIIGLNMVTLGDVQVPVNIMDQLESHFMLSGVGGKDASGSMRAQIVDEISGLSGIEGLIKAVSLDNHRFGREVSEVEEKMEETQKQLHDAEALEAERAILTEAGELLDNHDDCKGASSAGQETLDGWNSSVDEHDRLTAAMDAIPDVDSAKKHLEGADAKMETALGAGELSMEADKSSRAVSDLRKAEKALPDEKAALVSLDKTDEVLSVAVKAGELSEDFLALAGQRDELDAAEKALPDESDGETFLDAAEKALELSGRAGELAVEAGEVQGRVEELEAATGLLEGLDEACGLLEEAGRLQDVAGAASEANGEVRKSEWGVCALKMELAECEEKLAAAEAERDSVLASVTTCPLTMRPVSKECLETV